MLNKIVAHLLLFQKIFCQTYTRPVSVGIALCFAFRYM